MTSLPANSSPVTDAEVAWGSCCTTDDACPSPGNVPGVPWFRFAVGLFVAAQAMLFGLTVNLTPDIEPRPRLMLQGAILVATLIVMVMLGVPLLRDALTALRRRRLTMELFFVVGVLSSFTLSCLSMLRGSGPVYFEVVATLLIVYAIGRAITSHSRQTALASMRRFTDTLATAQRLPHPDATVPETVPVATIVAGDLVQVPAGQMIPVDGVIQRGQAFVRDSTFTGNWLPAHRSAGQHVLAGCLCEDGTLIVRVTASGNARRIDHLAHILRQAQSQPSRLQRLADRFVRWFLPGVLLLTLGTFGYWLRRSDLNTALFNALAVLLVACPCGAGLAAPLVMWRLLGRLAEKGLVLRTGDALEALASADSVLFDKTGTLGQERLELMRLDVTADPAQRAAILAILVTVERTSDHPLARALAELALPPDAPPVRVLRTEILPGQGLTATVQVQNEMHEVRLVREDVAASSIPAGAHIGMRMELSGLVVARAYFREPLRATAGSALTSLQDMGLPVRVLTGAEFADAELAAAVPVHARLTPEQKHQLVLALQKQEPHFRRPIYVGDGFNDAPAMAAAHTSIALISTGAGAAVTIDTASATLHGGNLDLIPQAVSLARHALHLIRSNLAWAVAYNLIGIALAVTGHLHPVAAALLMTASSAIVSWRSFRLTDIEDDAGQATLQAQTPRLPAGAREEKPRAVSVSTAAPSDISTSTRLRIFRALHYAGMIGQSLILIYLTRLSLLPSMLLLAGFIGCTWLVLRWWEKLPNSADMVWAMLTLGGLGMTFGWWADMNFGSVAQPLMSSCGHVLSDAAAVPAPAAHHGSGLLSWMNGLMLLLGVPAMFRVRYRREPFAWRKWCCTGMLVLGVPGMVLGMMAGGALTHVWFAQTAQPGKALLHWLLMTVGMCLGMMIPHALEYALPKPLRREIKP